MIFTRRTVARNLRYHLLTTSGLKIDNNRSQIIIHNADNSGDMELNSHYNSSQKLL